MGLQVQQQEFKLARHCRGIRENQIQVALMMLYLAGYEVELHYMGEPLTSKAKEELDSLEMDGVAIYSCSTTDGGIWETWQRDALKYGELKNSWNTWKQRNAL